VSFNDSINDSFSHGIDGHFRCNFWRGWKTSGWSNMRRRAVHWLVAGTRSGCSSTDHATWLYSSQDHTFMHATPE